MSHAERVPSIMILVAAALAGCRSAPDTRPSPTPADAAGTAGGSGADAAPIPTNAGPPPMPAPMPDAAGAGTSAPSGHDGGGRSDAAAAAFTCNLLVGPSPMMQWFDGGFLQQPGIDPTRWELITVAHHYTDSWASPADPAWGSALHKGQACARGATAPDRVIFQATQWSYTTAAQWQKDLAAIVENIRTRWPSVRRIELMASTSAPGDVPCPAANGKANETIIPAFAYQALDAMPDRFPGLVLALPHFEVPSCMDFIGNGTAPQYAPSATATTGPAVTEVAKMFGAWFAGHP
jgi:hypothetical protein